MKKTTKTARTPIYPRVTLENRKWLQTAAKKFKTTESNFIDSLLSYSKKNQSVFNVSKA